MATEQWYQFFDRDLIDPVIHLVWPELLRKVRWTRAVAKEVVQSVMPFDLSDESLEAILNHRDIFWTLRRSDDQLYLISQIAEALPGNRKRCPCVYRGKRVMEASALIATAADAFLSKRIGVGSLWSVFKLHDSFHPNEWLDMPEAVADLINHEMPVHRLGDPIFQWQFGDDAGTGYGWLGERDTTYFIGFIKRAWAGNWPVRWLTEWAMSQMGTSEGACMRFRDFDIAASLHKAIRVSTFTRPCLIWYRQ